MKQVIRLTEKELHNLISESVQRVLHEGLNEFSPEFAAHAADVADNQDRTRQAGRFKQYAADAWNRDYGFEGAKGAQLPSGKEPDIYDNYMSNKTYSPRLYKHDSQGTRAFGPNDNVEHIATNKLKPGHRNKVLGGLKSAENMRSGLDKNGQPFNY